MHVLNCRDEKQKKAKHKERKIEEQATFGKNKGKKNMKILF